MDEGIKKQAPQSKEEKKDDNFRYILRVANTDLDGNKAVGFALRKVKGISYSFSTGVCRLAKIDPAKKTGYLTDSEVGKLDEVISSPSKFKMPFWMFNRKKDPETGVNMHVLGGDLQFAKETDIKIMKKIKCYKGVRHMHGLPVRGQKTKSNFRRTKSRGKGGIGVQKKKTAAPAKK